MADRGGVRVPVGDFLKDEFASGGLGAAGSEGQRLNLLAVGDDGLGILGVLGGSEEPEGIDAAFLERRDGGRETVIEDLVRTQIEAIEHDGGLVATTGKDEFFLKSAAWVERIVLFIKGFGGGAGILHKDAVVAKLLPSLQFIASGERRIEVSCLIEAGDAMADAMKTA